MLGCVLIAFALCAPPGYYGGSYAYAQSGGYAYAQPYVVPQPVYVQPVYVPAAPAYYVPVQPYYGGGGCRRRYC